MTHADLASLGLELSMAVAAGLVGCFAVMRRMTLAADALSHVALPGIGLVLLLRVEPLWGALAMLIAGTVLIWGLERRTRLSIDAVVGVVFSAALAIGSLITSGEELIDALFGGAGKVSGVEVLVGAATAALVVAFVLWGRDRLVVALVSPDIARTSGIPVERLDLAFLVAFALTVALGLRFLGVLLMGSLIIIPAATAKRLAGSLRSMFAIAIAIAVASVVGGAWLGAAFHGQRGPLAILVAAAFFFGSLFYRRNG